MKEHQELVKNLCKTPEEIQKSLTPDKVHLLHMVGKLCSESGELFDAIGKWVFYEKPLDMENVMEELGDIEFYLEGARARLNILREDTLKHNVAKLTKRYGEKYSNEAAIKRADKE